MIVTIEGIDAAGKSYLANILSKKLNLPVLEIDFKRGYTEFSTSEWKSVIYGCNEMLCSVYRCLDNFIKTRFQLSEYVYSRYYKRNGYDFDVMDNCGIEKNILILSLISFNRYLQLSEKRKDKELFTENQFSEQQNLFIEAFEKSKVKNKLIYEVERESIEAFLIRFSSFLI